MNVTCKHDVSIKEINTAGQDAIPCSLLLNCAHELAPSLLILFKQSISSGVIDPSLKRAAIVPVLKLGDRTAPSNYRPISLTSVIIKVLERIIRKQIVAFLVSKGYYDSRLHMVEPPRGRSFIWQIGVNSSIQDQRQV